MDGKTASTASIDLNNIYTFSKYKETSFTKFIHLIHLKKQKMSQYLAF